MIQNSKFKIQNSSRGFTLIELIVVIAIVGILATTALVNFGKNDDRDVRMEKERLTSFFRDVQNKALTGEIVSTGASEKVCGFGAHWDSSGKIQAYYNVVSGLNTGCESSSKTYDSSHLSDAFYLRSGVTAGSFVDAFFLIPNGETYKNGSVLSGSNTITIGLTKGSVTINPAITIDAAGNIK